MGIRRSIRWKEISGNKLNKENLPEVLGAVGAAVLFDILCGWFFLRASVSLLGDVYENYHGTVDFWMRGMGLIFGISILLELAEYLRKPWNSILRLGVTAGGVLSLLWWLLQKNTWERLVSGFFGVASVYAEYWNLYFGDNWNIVSDGDSEITYFIETVLLILMVLFFLLGKQGGRNLIMAVVPLLLFCAELLVGIFPEGKGIFFLFFGILLAVNQTGLAPDFRLSEKRKGKNSVALQGFCWMIAALVILLTSGITFLAGRTASKKLVTEYSGKAEDFVLDTANRVANWEIWRLVDDPGQIEKIVESILGTENFNYERLDNRAPEYKDLPVLQVTLEKLPAQRMYLKGFYADVYDNGLWERTYERLETACKEKNISPETVTEELAVLGVDKIKKRYNVKRLSSHSTGIDGSVFYHDPSTVKAYLPYFSEVSTEGVSVDGEGNFMKRLSGEELSFTAWEHGGSFEIRLTNFDQGITKTWEPWYESYVLEHYLTVPENMPNVVKIATELAAEELDRTTLGSITSENEERLAKGFLVADWMGRNTTYSMKLPYLPWGEDPIEYFLGTSRKGYCMHYASAAVMILRQLGVPARYASGYTVGPADFKAEKNGYVTEILDSQAHAWAEIYLDGIGWVPMEVTAGYTQLLPTPTPTPAPTNTPTPTPTPTPTNTPTPVPTVPLAPDTPSVTPGAETSPAPTSGAGEKPNTGGETTATATPSPTPTPTPTPTPLPTSQDYGNEVNDEGIEGVKEENNAEVTGTPGVERPQSPLGSGKISWKKFLGKTALIFLLVVVLALILLSPATLVDSFFRLEKMTHRRILKEMKRKGNARAIKLLNRAIYRKLRFSEMVKKDCTDEEYEAALKSNFSVLWPKDWERYMDIVKAAEFSTRDFTDEEVEFCYKIYRDVIY